MCASEGRSVLRRARVRRMLSSFQRRSSILLLCHRPPPPSLLTVSYALSFSEQFFCDDEPEKIAASDLPTSVYQAIVSIERTQWQRIARDVFHADPDRLDPWQVLEKVRSTNTCSNLDSPVHVWIDEEGWHSIDVYDRQAWMQ